jgi:hypothetical protein
MVAKFCDIYTVFAMQNLKCMNGSVMFSLATLVLRNEYNLMFWHSILSCVFIRGDLKSQHMALLVVMHLSILIPGGKGAGNVWGFDREFYPHRRAFDKDFCPGAGDSPFNILLFPVNCETTVF